ncbi:ArsR family transcriptional regulator [Egicoccus sp. AB-alg2]|uniref:arsenate reductase/protein-tyrosine-phosphatase family protein n=1 Tax=Egicoccus sp. AB-alg2 TaxID=3242693 RepID=UPI00359DAC9B
MTLDTSARARVHAALGEPHRLQLVDALRLSDLTPSELREVSGLDSNLLAFHLGTLEEAGVIARRRSQGDGRRRYVTLRWETLEAVEPMSEAPTGPVLFVCSRNAARSQLAAALWRARTQLPADSAGRQPAPEIDPLARAVAEAHGLPLGDDPRPRGYDEIGSAPDLVVSVCDRAREAALPWTTHHLHWSVADPRGGDLAAYEATLQDLDRRIARLAATLPDRAA